MTRRKIKEPEFFGTDSGSAHLNGRRAAFGSEHTLRGSEDAFSFDHYASFRTRVIVFMCSGNNSKLKSIKRNIIFLDRNIDTI